jgi:hypothetical protein
LADFQDVYAYAPYLELAARFCSGQAYKPVDQGAEQGQLILVGLLPCDHVVSNIPHRDAGRLEHAPLVECEDETKLKALGLEATGPARKTVLEMLDRARNRPLFGNGGEVDFILNAAKGRHQLRVTKTKCKHGLLTPEDFDPEFDRAQRPETNVDLLFQDTVGCEETIQLLKGYQQSAKKYKELGLDPREVIPFNFLFRGPPGTGKTTTAKKFGKVFYDMGLLAAAEVLEKVSK